MENGGSILMTIGIIFLIGFLICLYVFRLMIYSVLMQHPSVNPSVNPGVNPGARDHFNNRININKIDKCIEHGCGGNIVNGVMVPFNRACMEKNIPHCKKIFSQ